MKLQYKSKHVHFPDKKECISLPTFVTNKKGNEYGKENPLFCKITFGRLNEIILLDFFYWALSWHDGENILHQNHCNFLHFTPVPIKSTAP